jgi:hypothetical protein
VLVLVIILIFTIPSSLLWDSFSNKITSFEGTTYACNLCTDNIVRCKQLYIDGTTIKVIKTIDLSTMETLDGAGNINTFQLEWDGANNITFGGRTYPLDTSLPDSQLILTNPTDSTDFEIVDIPLCGANDVEIDLTPLKLERWIAQNFNVVGHDITYTDDDTTIHPTHTIQCSASGARLGPRVKVSAPAHRTFKQLVLKNVYNN